MAISVGTSARLGARRRMFGLSPAEASFARRGFYEGSSDARLRLERIGYTFLEGYHAALEDDDRQALAARLNSIENEFRGFAFEGAAMALALLDTLTPWKRDRWFGFVSGPAASHVYMMHVGYGWALARLNRLHRSVQRSLLGEANTFRMDPLLRWLALDGYGFHEGYFYWRRYVQEQELPRGLTGYALNVFDQGLGRSLWFVNGAEVARIPHTILGFAPTRHADLWSGLGLACAYAGGVDAHAIEQLRVSAGPYAPHLAQGAAFAAQARRRAGNPAPHTDLACRILCGLSAEGAAEVTDAALHPDVEAYSLSPASNGTTYVSAAVPDYELWRQRIRAEFIKEAAMP